MSNRRDNDPSLDYFELRRRHEEYKNRERLAKLEKKGIDRTEPPRTRPQANASVQPAASEISEPSVNPNESVEWGPDATNVADGEDNSVELDAPVERATPVEADTSAEPEAFEEDDYNTAAADDGYEAEDMAESSETGYEDDYEDESFVDENPNPFDSFIRVFHGLKNRLSQRRNRRNAVEEAPDEYDEEYFEDESSMDGEAPAEDDAGESTAEAVENAPAHRGFFARKRASKAQFEELSGEIEDVPMNEALDVEDEPPAGAALDIEDDLPIPQAKSIDGDRHREDPEIDEDDEGYEYEDYSEDEVDEGVSDNLSRFQKFLRLFIVPIDPDEDAGDDEDERTAIHMNVESSEGLWDDDNVYVNTDETRHNPHAVADEIEGGLEMADQNKVNPELTNQLAADLERPGLSRRERRELAERLAAERAAAEQANTKAQKSVDAAEIPDLFAEQPLEADSIENVSSGIVDIKPTQQNDAISSVDEPTREFKPVSMLNFDEFMNAVETSQKSDLLNDQDGDDEDEDDEDEKPARRSIFSRRSRKEDEDEDDEDEDEDDEDEEVKPRKRFFGRKAARYDEDDEDEEDYDDEDDDEEEDIKPKSRRNKKSRRDRYDDEDDDYDEYDDYDDDEDDYDDYDDEDDDYDDDDEDDVGIGLLSVLKALVVIFLILVVLFFVVNILNLVNVISLDSIAAKLPSGVVNVLLPSQNFKSSDNAGNDIDFSTPDNVDNAVDDQNTQGVDLTPTESATEVPPTSSPDLDLTGGNTGDGQTSTVTNVPSDNVGAANSVG